LQASSHVFILFLYSLFIKLKSKKNDKKKNMVKKKNVRNLRFICSTAGNTDII